MESSSLLSCVGSSCGWCKHVLPCLEGKAGQSVNASYGGQSGPEIWTWVVSERASVGFLTDDNLIALKT